MKPWMPSAITALVLFIINVIARVTVVVTGQSADQDAEFTIGLYATVAMGALALAAGIWWSIRKPIVMVVQELGAALLVAGVLSVLVAPLLVGTNPFGQGFEWFLIQLFFFTGVNVVFGLLGFLVTIILGKDHKSAQLKSVVTYYGDKRSPKRR